MNPRRSGAVWLAAAVALELGGFLVLVWQEQNVYTINQAFTLPAFAVMVLGIGLAHAGYRRLLGSFDRRASVGAIVAGAVVGALALTGAIGWQLADGLLPTGDLNLEVFGLAAVFFVGVALLAVGLAEIGSRSRSESSAVPGSPSPPRTVAFASATVGLAVGLTLLVTPLVEAGWFNAEAADVNSLYQIVALELSAGGVWLLLAGFRSLRMSAPASASLAAPLGGRTVGVVLVAAGLLWWWRTPNLVYALGEIIALGLVAGGLGLLVLANPPEG